MRPRKSNGLDVVRFPRPAAHRQDSLELVDAPPTQSESPEIWLGLHIRELPAGGAALEKLATRAHRFTPRVCLVPPDGLLLEVKGSLHLFKGTQGLIQSVIEECAALQLEVVIAIAPTPMAATVAARVGQSDMGQPNMGQPNMGQPFVVTNKAQLIGRLSALPLGPLRWADDVVERLARMGVRTIGHVLRLPRAGFARRFGPSLLAELDRLTGRTADLRRSHRPRERFRRRRELTYELDNTETLLVAMAPLLVDLGRFLRERQAGVAAIECLFRHRHSPPTCCELRLTSPAADVGRLTELLRERLHNLVLPEPARSCELRTGVPMVRAQESICVWRSGEYGGSPGAESPELIERLRARLGHECVYGLKVLAAHRPEAAWSTSEPDAKANSTRAPWSPFTRPLWLLAEPQQLEERNGVPRRRGSLDLYADVERIESGWWDGGDVGRDYYRARDIHGVLLWIFRERAEPHHWFLHGVFG